MIVTMIEKVYSFLWGDLIRIPLPGGSTLGISLLILLLIPTGIYFTIRTKLLPIRLFPDMVRALSEKKSDKKNLSAFQTLIVSTATRVGMGNLVGVVAAISAGGAGAVFWMWITALIGSSTAFIEAMFRDGDSRTISATKSSYKELTQALLDLGIPAEDIGEINID